MNGEQHFSCMDVLHIKATTRSGVLCDCGVLLEVWPTGGLIHADEPIGKGEKFTVSFSSGEVEAQVQDYESDAFGSYIRFEVAQPWFPDSYNPQYLQTAPEHELAGVC